MNTPLNPDEAILRTGGANFQHGIETVGGKLYLTNRRLIFESHALNIQRGATLIPLDDVSSATKCWTKFLNLIPLMPNSLAITITQGQEFRFGTVWPRRVGICNYKRQVSVVLYDALNDNPLTPDNALQRTEAGGGAFSVFRVLRRQPPALGLGPF